MRSQSRKRVVFLFAQAPFRNRNVGSQSRCAPRHTPLQPLLSPRPHIQILSIVCFISAGMATAGVWAGYSVGAQCCAERVLIYAGSRLSKGHLSDSIASFDTNSIPVEASTPKSRPLSIQETFPLAHKLSKEASSTLQSTRKDSRGPLLGLR